MTRRGLVVFILLTGISTPLPLLSVGYPWPVAAAVLLVCIAAAVIVSRVKTNDRGFPSSEATLLEDFIRATLTEPGVQMNNSLVED